MAAITTLHPDIIFLDVQMPVMNGFEVVRCLPGPALPVVVMVTAFDREAIRALEAGGVDYLLKPVSGARLRRALARVQNLLGKPDAIRSRIAAIRSVPPAGSNGYPPVAPAPARSRRTSARPRRLKGR